MSSISPGPPVPTPSFHLKNITFDDNDSSLSYTKGWNRSLSSAAHGGSFQSSNTVGDVVHFSLPANAVAVYYFGFKQKSGSLCEACVDCSADSKGQLEQIDGHDNDPPKEPTLLYQKDNLDPTKQHSFALVNFPDSRFGNHSTITVDSFIVTVQEEQVHSSSSSSSSSTSMMSSMSALSMVAIKMSTNDDVPVQTQAEEPTSTSLSATPSASGDSAEEEGTLSSGQRTAQKLREPLKVTGIAIAVVFVVSTILFALMYFMRRRKRKRTAPGRMLDQGHWAARFFGSGSGGRGSIWVGSRGPAEEKGERSSAKDGAMVEKRGADRPTRHGSLPSRPDMSVTRPPPVSNLVLPPRSDPGRPWVQPAYHPYSATHLQRTIPRSAFTAVPAARPTPSPVDSLNSQGGDGDETAQLARMRSSKASIEFTHPPPKSAPAEIARMPISVSIPVPLPVPARVPTPGLPRSPNPAQNPHLAEARARVRDRARGIADVNRSASGQVNAYYGPAQPVPPVPPLPPLIHNAWNTGNGVSPVSGRGYVYEYGNSYVMGGPQQYRVHNPDTRSWASEYSQ